MNLAEQIAAQCGKEIPQCTNHELYEGLLAMVQKEAMTRESQEGKKKVYYISAEFLIGKLLSNNLINLGWYDEVQAVLNAHGKDLCEVEEAEPEPSLGNGGLGRLAACFLDSMASLGLNGAGIGLNYHLGLFKQEFEHGLQKETPNPWIEKKKLADPQGNLLYRSVWKAGCALPLIRYCGNRLPEPDGLAPFV